MDGGFFVFDPKVANYVQWINKPFKSGVMVRIANESKLLIYHNEGFGTYGYSLQKRELEKETLLETSAW